MEGTELEGEEMMFGADSRRLSFFLESLEYAKRVQDALLPSSSMMAPLPPHYVLNLPKDVVSGDFYYYHTGDQHVIIVADSTGHGISAALISAMAHAVLVSIMDQGVTKPSMILNMMDKRMYEILQSRDEKEERIRDSIDVACVRINDSLTEAFYSGANRPMWICREGVFTEIKKDRMTIGGDKYPQDKDFTDHRIELRSGDSIYMFSDGMADQFGGPKGRKMMRKGMQKILLASHELPLIHRRGFILRKIDEWRGTLEQTDDVLLLGIQIPE